MRPFNPRFQSFLNYDEAPDEQMDRQAMLAQMPNRVSATGVADRGDEEPPAGAGQVPPLRPDQFAPDADTAAAWRSNPDNQFGQATRALTAGAQGGQRMQAPNGDYQALFNSVMSKHGYGPEALRAAIPELQRYGIQVLIDGSDLVRGRVILPNGNKRDVFDPREGRTETNNWKTNPLQDGQWAWQDMGFEGGESAPQLSYLQALQKPPAPPATSEAAAPMTNVADQGDSEFFDQILASIKAQRGEDDRSKRGDDDLERQALLSLL